MFATIATLSRRMCIRACAIAALMMFVAVTLPGCGSSSSPVGTWTMDGEATKAAMQTRINEQVASGDVTKENGDMAMGMASMITAMKVTITFKADGTVQLGIAMPGQGDAPQKSGTWTAKGSDLTITLEGEKDPGHAQLVGNTLNLQGKGNNPSMVFKRS